MNYKRFWFLKIMMFRKICLMCMSKNQHICHIYRICLISLIYIIYLRSLIQIPSRRSRRRRRSRRYRIYRSCTIPPPTTPTKVNGRVQIGFSTMVISMTTVTNESGQRVMLTTKTSVTTYSLFAFSGYRLVLTGSRRTWHCV